MAVSFASCRTNVGTYARRRYPVSSSRLPSPGGSSTLGIVSFLCCKVSIRVSWHKQRNFSSLQLLMLGAYVGKCLRPAAVPVTFCHQPAVHPQLVVARSSRSYCRPHVSPSGCQAEQPCYWVFGPSAGRGEPWGQRELVLSLRR